LNGTGSAESVSKLVGDHNTLQRLGPVAHETRLDLLEPIAATDEQPNRIRSRQKGRDESRAETLLPPKADRGDGLGRLGFPSLPSAWRRRRRVDGKEEEETGGGGEAKRRMCWRRRLCPCYLSSRRFAFISLFFSLSFRWRFRRI
jgi:hypothetical protein